MKLTSKLTAAICVSAAAATTLAFTGCSSSIPADAVEFGNSKYLVYNEGKTWEEAQEYCKKLGGHLVTITSQEEQDFVRTLITDTTKFYYWIGFNRNADTGEFEWVGGEKSDYTNWKEGQPNNYMDMENYATLSVETGEWEDNWNNDTDSPWNYEQGSGFICEWAK